MAAHCPICKRAISVTAPAPRGGAITVTAPALGGGAGSADDERPPYFPFCSQRCKLVDLDGWFSGRYVVSDELPLDESDGLPPTDDD
jgi:endogenous inhibitor of DNA gyrase (YacG/DUF329 family)